MFKQEDLLIICCPICRSDLIISNSEKLKCANCNTFFPITNGIPRLLYFGDEGVIYNEMWDYKWTVLDGGKGYNFQIIDPENPAYEIHNVFRFNEYNGEAFKDLEDGIAIDVGCGIGQYTVELLKRGAKKSVPNRFNEGSRYRQENIRRKIS